MSRLLEVQLRGEMKAPATSLFICCIISYCIFFSQNVYSFTWTPSYFLLRETRRAKVDSMNVGLRSQSLYCIHQSTVEFDASTIGVDPGLFSDAIIELGASSVSVKDRAFGTEEETPIFRHHSQSRLWRGGRGKGQDPDLVLAKGEQEGRSGQSPP